MTPLESRDSDVLRIAVGTATQAGRGHANQDAVAAGWSDEAENAPARLAVAIADGIGSSEVSAEAAQAAVAGFVADYHCTPAAWSVRTAGNKIITALNAWLHARTLGSRYRQDMDRGYVCTFSALVAAGQCADLFHVGDTRIYRCEGERLAICTQDHRMAAGSGGHHLGRALGMAAGLSIDHHRLALSEGDVFVLASDGAYEAWIEDDVIAALARHANDVDAAASEIVAGAQARDDSDDASVIVLRVEALPETIVSDFGARAAQLAVPGELAPRSRFEGFTIVRELSVSARSRVYLAHSVDRPEAACVIKTPGPDMAASQPALARFLLEEWIARRLDNPHVLKALAPRAPGQALYVAFEYIDGQGLDRWHADHRKPEMARVREIVAQVGQGLLAFHRRQMIHQDLRPANVLLDATGTARIIDFGAVRIHGVDDPGDTVPGTEQFAAPEYFAGEAASPASDQYALAAITYYLLTGHLPYGPTVSRATTRAAQARLAYRPISQLRPDVPRWVDDVIRRGVHVDPARRYEDVACFVDALSRAPFERDTRHFVPWVERDPVRLWQATSTVLALGVLALGCYIGLVL